VEHSRAQSRRDVLACDFFVAISATFRMLDVFVVSDVGTRQIRHWNVTGANTRA
jgi:putative transposase